jgi:mannose-6-phosphate isomerase-like protein (cupin superfamily)
MDKAHLISFPAHKGNKGDLTMFQGGSGLPFSIGKVVTIQGMNTDTIRGQHAHHKMQEIVVALQGGCEIEIDDGTTKETFVVDNPNTALYIPPQVWRTLRNFQPDTILLLIADLPYDEAETDYIREYEEFLRL